MQHEYARCWVVSRGISEIIGKNEEEKQVVTGINPLQVSISAPAGFPS